MPVFVGARRALLGRSAAPALSQAAARFGGRTDGIVINFADDAFFASTGFYGSARVKDTITPANNNNYDSHPFGLVTYTTPVVKMVRGPFGLYRYQRHNLFVNSAVPVTQSIGATLNATYEVVVTGPGSVALSNAGAGTASAGSPVAFTAGSGTLVCTVSGSPTSVHVRRTPSDSGYVATGAATKFELPFEWDRYGNLIGILSEDSRANRCLWASDLTNAAWVKTNVTAAKTATGITGVANSATTLTLTASSGKVLQSITRVSAQRLSYCRIRRRTGTPTVEMTQDDYSTYSAVAITDEWTEVGVVPATLANPVAGLRITGNIGDQVDVELFQHVEAAIRSSPIETFAAAFTRTGDNISVAATQFPTSQSALTLGGHFETSKTSNNAVALEVLSTSHSTNSAAFTVSTANTSFNVLDASATQALLVVQDNAYLTGDFLRISASAAPNDFRSYRDGLASPGNPDTSGTLFTAPISKLAVGGIGNGTSTLEGHIKEIYYFPSTSTNDELAALNTPVGALEKSQSAHLLGDSFLNGTVLQLYVANGLNNKARSISKDGVGGSSLLAQAARFDLTPWYYDQTLIIMDGGLSDTLAEAQAAIASELAHLTHNRWLYIEGGYSPGTQETGMPARLVQDSIHEWLIANYPTHYVPTLGIMQSYSDGSGGDIAAVAAGLWPTSQTSDGLHPSDASGKPHLAQIIVDAVNARGW
ncbi:hypothetical protein [Mesorhizobium sp. M0965]|uniref:hypothetical protein n=1 Tax=Mesorhizobium sp. M0965 TaxID=2957036 RepID=UPI003335E3FB